MNEILETGPRLPLSSIEYQLKMFVFQSISKKNVHGSFKGRERIS